ncbi:MAG: OB-fold domain-containing protein [Actinobacteria bacterium ATB1]|nr:OB-fold domain-containing protein [Actinobacteria bacterium ATB1]
MSVIETVIDGAGARLWAFTTVNAAPPGYEGPVPYGFGVVELPGGMRLVTRLTETDHSVLEEGMPMVLTHDVVATDADGTEVVSWAFAPAGGTEP